MSIRLQVRTGRLLQVVQLLFHGVGLHVDRICATPAAPPTMETFTVGGV